MITVKAIDGVFTCYENDWIIKEVESCGAFSRPELAMISGFLHSGDTVVDVGAHIGTFSIPLKKKIGAQGKLFAFEANPETYKLLEKNIKDNDVEIRSFNKGVSDKVGFLYLRAKNLKTRDVCSSPDAPLNSGADYLTPVITGDSSDYIKVDLVQIDDVINEKIHFMKIDVEGMEMSVLRSAQKTIDLYRPIIYSEYFDYYLKRSGENPLDYQTFFKQRNYHFFINATTRKAANDEFMLVRVPGPKYIRGQVDFLLIPDDSDRYPKKFTDWKFYHPHQFLWNRLRNTMSSLKAGVRYVFCWERVMKTLTGLAKNGIYAVVNKVSGIPRVARPLRNLCQYYIRCYEGYSYDMSENGERQILTNLYPEKKDSKFIFLDVGANKGGWSKIAKKIFPNARIHCFEPSSDTFKTLMTELSLFDDIRKNNFALSNMHTQLRFNNYGHGSGRNSFVQNPSYPHGPVEIVEEVDVWTAKEYIERENLPHIDFMKIDVEGWEYYVLLGLEEYLNPEFVSVIQFEYGYAHGDSKTLMKDFYKLLEGKGYRIGKLKKNKVEFSPFVHHLNNFESGPNFIACHPDFQDQLSRFPKR